MKGDFTRDTFDPTRHFSRVLMQQGRVQLDADWNEQAEILLHYVRTVVTDLIGPHAGPVGHLGFAITASPDGTDLVIGPGRYYVGGLLCENEPQWDAGANETKVYYIAQPHYRLSKEKTALPNGKAFVYLDVWERMVNSLEDDRIRESALGGPDTSVRAQVIWQVRTQGAREKLTQERQAREAELKWWQSNRPAATDRIKVIQDRLDDLDRRLNADTPDDRLEVTCDDAIANRPSISTARMRARVKPNVTPTDVCIQKPDAKYRGAENRLYRVEIHSTHAGQPATFKWSRDNGSVAARLLNVDGDELVMSHTRGFEGAGWVEVIGRDADLQGETGQLHKVKGAEADRVAVEPPPNVVLAEGSVVIVRRWDHREGEDIVLADDYAVPVQQAGSPDGWIRLEDGVEVKFELKDEQGNDATFRTGDYWLIPARVASGGIEWPAEKNSDGDDQYDNDGNVVPAPLPPRGVVHHYAPLAIITVNDKKVDPSSVSDCRTPFKRIPDIEEASG